MQDPSDRAWMFFTHCKKSLQKHGRDLKFPKNTDPKKTYKWRYLEHFVHRVDSWGISDDLACRLIDSIIKHAKSSNQLHKGIMMLASNQFLEIGYRDIMSNAKAESSILTMLTREHDFMNQYTDKIATLVHKRNRHAFPNIVLWHKQGILSSLYISLSKPCMEALGKLNNFDRSCIPNAARLLLNKQDLLNNAIIKTKAKLILGDEWANGF